MAAENQAFSSLRTAAERIGHEVVQYSNSREIDRDPPDFVLASASTQPKLNDVPHYGVIHEPRDRFLVNRDYFNNLLTYDGYLTISDTLERFLRNVTYGVGRPQPIGFYYNTCQRQTLAADLACLTSRRMLRITYFGTNWDKRRQQFFRKFSEAEGVQICGPRHSWTHISPNGYGGTVEFDGSSVQKTYAANGIGLCLLSDLHLRDNIISNRIFEVTSVGAIAFCCDIPWIRDHFGDSVYYFDQNLPDQALRRAILQLRDIVYSNPVAAMEKAQRAREIFERKFAAEVLLENAVEYHQLVNGNRTSRLKQAQEKYCPFISVIIRCGSRPVEFFERALESISKQTVGCFEVIAVRHQELDLAPALEVERPRIRTIKVIDCDQGSRSTCLWAGLSAVTGDYFAILDDDDFWFSNHIESLFQPLPERRLEHFFAYSGGIAMNPVPLPIDGGGADQRQLYCFGIRSTESWSAAASAFASNSFVASRDLLDSDLLLSPEMQTGEDSYLILSLAARTKPKFSYSATSVFERSLSNHSGFADHPNRYEDELTLQLRLFGRHRPDFLKGDPFDSLADYWAERDSRFSTPAQVTDPTLDWDQVGGGYDKAQSNVCQGSRLVDANLGSAIIRTPALPWSYAAELRLNAPLRPATEYALVIDILVNKGIVGIGLLNPAEDDFIFRKQLDASPQVQTVRIMVVNFDQIGRFLIQNGDAHSESGAELHGLRLFAEPA
jgi:glycosyltransferase involved in cell wall biosynthesis